MPLGGSAHSMKHVVNNNNAPKQPSSVKTHRIIRPSPQLTRHQQYVVDGGAADQIPRSSSSYDAKNVPNSRALSASGSLDFDHMSLASDAKYPTVPAVVSDARGPSSAVVLPGGPRSRPPGSSGGSSVHSRTSHSPAAAANAKIRLSPIGSSPTVALSDERYADQLVSQRNHPSNQQRTSRGQGQGESGYYHSNNVRNQAVDSTYRPMNFVSALAMSDQLSEREKDHARRARARMNSDGDVHDERSPKHDLSGSAYEISV